MYSNESSSKKIKSSGGSKKRSKKGTWGSRERTSMSFLIVIAFFAIFGIIILTEVSWIAVSINDLWPCSTSDPFLTPLLTFPPKLLVPPSIFLSPPCVLCFNSVNHDMFHDREEKWLWHNVMKPLLWWRFQLWHRQVLMIDDRNSVSVRRTSVNRFSESLPDYEDVKVS